MSTYPPHYDCNHSKDGAVECHACGDAFCPECEAHACDDSQRECDTCGETDLPDGPHACPERDGDMPCWMEDSE